MADMEIDNLLLKSIERNDKEIAEINRQIYLFENQIKCIKEQNSAYLEEYQRRCEHSKVKKRQVSYMAGGYAHVSQSTYEYRCGRCEKLMKTQVERGTYA